MEHEDWIFPGEHTPDQSKDSKLPVRLLTLFHFHHYSSEDPEQFAIPNEDNINQLYAFGFASPLIEDDDDSEFTDDGIEDGASQCVKLPDIKEVFLDHNLVDP